MGRSTSINERQARELAKVPAGHRADTWAAVVRERGAADLNLARRQLTDAQKRNGGKEHGPTSQLL